MAVLSWNLLKQQPGGTASGMWLMQDGSVLMNQLFGTQLKLLRPDGSGSYVNGTWSLAGNFLAAKASYAAAVLSDGRLVTCGGEHNSMGGESNFCEIYDPLTQSSTSFPPPPGWNSIGDAPTAVLNDGTVLLGNTQGQGPQGPDGPTQVALLNPSTLTWTFGGIDAGNNEQTYTLMQTGDVLTTGVYAQTSWRFEPSVNAFVEEDASLPVMLGDYVVSENSHETGPAITMMDGRVICFGATGHTCIYTPSRRRRRGHWLTGSWVQGPDLPKVLGGEGDQLIAADVPALLEPNGSVLLVAFGATTSTTAFVEYDPQLNSFAVISGVGVPAIPNDWENTKMLLLPNGNGLVSLSLPEQNWFEIEFSKPSFSNSIQWSPSITSFPESVIIPPFAGPYVTVTLSGVQLCGLSECTSYGDDNQQAENYPVAWITEAANNQNGMTYVRAHNVSTRSIAPNQPSTVEVDIPTDLPEGTYDIVVVAMGITSIAAEFEIIQQLGSSWNFP